VTFEAGTGVTATIMKSRVSRFIARSYEVITAVEINPLNAKLNPICHLLALLVAHHIFHVSGPRVKDPFL
jgi:hypothetical protein